MGRILIATLNPGKVKEFESLLAPTISCSLPGAGEFSKTPPDVVEDGATYRENALKKAKAFFDVYKVPVLADDSGLEVDALGGAPGVLSARWGGAALTYPERWAHLHLDLKRIPDAQWTCRFRCVLCYYDSDATPHYFEATTEGRLMKTPVGTSGFGYDPIFFSEALKKSFGEASFDEKQRVSHRSQAVQAFLLWWKGRNVA